MADLVAQGPDLDAADDRAVREALAPAIWLLERAREGIGLTQTGALNRAFVRETAERFPAWWDPEPFGPPNREAEFVLLREIHDLQRRNRLLRRDGARIVTTRRGNALALDPQALLTTLSAALFGDANDFDAVCAELATALILAGADIDPLDLAATIGPAIAAEGWNAGGLPPSDHDIAVRYPWLHLCRRSPRAAGARVRDATALELSRSAHPRGARGPHRGSARSRDRPVRALLSPYRDGRSAESNAVLQTEPVQRVTTIRPDIRVGWKVHR